MFSAFLQKRAKVYKSGYVYLHSLILFFGGRKMSLNKKVAVIMGSDSDLPVVKNAVKVLKNLLIYY